MSLNVLLESSGFMGLDLVKILLHLLNFAILLVIVGVLINKPMMKLIRERQETCKKQIEEHESKMKEAADVKAEYEALMRDAAQEISEQKATATQEIETRREEELASAKRQASAMLEQAGAEIAAEKIRAVHEMKGE
ncbi:MAG: ATP synthase F0 subunit B, partial [Christensenellaceae bacterium]